MDATIKRKDRVKNYFIAWKNYDVEMISSIFLPTAKYIIRGKRCYEGINEIIEYWRRNEKRQMDLRLKWKIINSNARQEIVYFSACFMDMETDLYTKVNGQIIFYYDESNRITKLSEAYRKRVYMKEELQ